MTRLLAIVLLLLLAMSSGQALAHALQPGYLELEALGDDTWRAFWRKPAVAGAPMPIDVALPQNCEPSVPPEMLFDGVAFVTQWVTNCPGGLVDGRIEITGLDKTITDVLVRYELTPGQGEARRLTPDDISFLVPEEPGTIDVLATYIGLGIDHILAGLDHLLFVLALLLSIRDLWRLVGAVTAFTVAHSLTLVAATLGWIVVPGPPVEAAVALSIMFLASELIKHRDDETRLSERDPWIVAFSFGLLHGLGFAGALQEIGLPEGDIPLALFAFNLGVEAGQLLFIGLCLSVWLAFRRLAPILANPLRGIGGRHFAGYAIGSVASFWFITRIAAF